MFQRAESAAPVAVRSKTKQMKNMRIQLYATLACFLLTLVTTYGQG